MGIVSRFERRLQDAVGDGLARVFGGSVMPKEVEAALQQEAADNIRELDGGHRLAPNSYVIAINSSDYGQLTTDDHDLTVRAYSRHLQDYIREQGWQTYGEVRVVFEASPTLHTGQFRTSARVDPDVGRRTPNEPNRANTARPPATPLSGAGPMTQNSGYDPRREPADPEERRGRAEYPGEARNGARGFATPLSGGRGGYQNGNYPPAEQGYGGGDYGRGGYQNGNYPPGTDRDYNGYEQGADYQNGYDQGSYGRPGAERGGYGGQGYADQGYGNDPGYGGGPGYVDPHDPGYGGQGGSNGAPGYSDHGYDDAHQAYGTPADRGGYGDPGYGGQQPGYGDAGGYGDAAGYGGQQPGYGDAAGYADPHEAGYAAQGGSAPGYADPGYDDAHQAYGTPADRGGYGDPGYGGQQPGYGGRPAPGYGGDAGYGQPPAAGKFAGGPPSGGYPQANPAGGGYSATGFTASLQLDDGSGRTYQLREGSNIIGRGQDAHFRLPDTGVSRRHIEVRWDGQMAMLSDLGSTNGTLVNGSPVQDWQLADGDVIRAGHSEILIRIV